MGLFIQFIVVFSNMIINRAFLIIILPVFLLGACSFISDTVFPGSRSDAPPPPSSSDNVNKETSSDASNIKTSKSQPPKLGGSRFNPTPITPGQNTGTFVGQKVSQLRNELSQLQNNIITQNQRLQNVRQQITLTSQQYHGIVAAIQARLQVGTTPGNPVLVSQWNMAQTELDRLGDGINLLNSLANSVASDSAFAAFLLESTQATFGLSGAIDEDHRQLVILEDETNRTVVLIDRLLNELSEDVSRQTAYVGNERSNLTSISLAIKNGEILGPSLGSRTYASLQNSKPLGIGPTRSSSKTLNLDNRQPLVVIRFDRPDVPFERALFAAINRSLEQRPNARFDLVAVAPNKGTPAKLALNASKSKEHASKVLRAMTDMGLPGNRVNISATSSDKAVTNEVHIYLR